jgi:hypothetical protein
MFTTNCTNKGCRKFQEPYLDVKTNKVFCGICNQEIENISPFTKNTMKTLKQTRSAKSTKSFAVKCGNCQIHDRPILQKNLVCCSSCKKQIKNLPESFVIMLKEELKRVDMDG